MSVTDPVTVGVVIAGVNQIAKQAQDFIAAVSGHPGESLGTILGNFGKRRFDNIEAVGNKAHLTLLNIGVTPGEVPLNVLHPLLDAASVQEDPTLQDTWANLLANAADPRQINRVSASFPGILKELSGREVKFLDALYENANGRLEGIFHFDSIAQIAYDITELMDLYVSCGLAKTDSLHVVAGVDGASPEQKKDREEFFLMLDAIRRQDVLRDVTYSDPKGIWSDAPENTPLRTQFHVTTLGVAFVNACRPPKPS
jgi:hypothetical protein